MLFRSSYAKYDKNGKIRNNEELRQRTLNYRKAIEANLPAKQLTPCDIVAVVPALKDFDSPLSANIIFSSTFPEINIKKLTIASNGGEISMDAHGKIANWDTTPVWNADINHLDMSAQTVAFVKENLKGQKTDIPAHLSNLA